MESSKQNLPPSIDSDTSSLLMAKIVAMVVLGTASFAIGLIPAKLAKITAGSTTKSSNQYAASSLSSNTSLKKNDDKNLLISLLLCFGGGVLLFTTFIHLQPEVRDGFKAASLEYFMGGAPISELVFCVGFFLVYLIEELVHLYLHSRIKGQSAIERALHRSMSIRRCGATQELQIPRVSLTSVKSVNGKFDDGSSLSYISGSNSELIEATSDGHGHGHSHGHHLVDADDDLKSSLGGFLAVLALSFHAVFEGLAVGLEGSVQNVWYLFGAIATHKLVIAFCVGVELVSSSTRTLLLVIYIGTFAVVTPLGIGIGLLLGGTVNGEADVTALVLQGMAAGTLLYVVFFEVLARERENHHSGIWQLFAIFAGFAIMFGLQIATGHGHNHGGDTNHQHHHHHSHHS